MNQVAENQLKDLGNQIIIEARKFQEFLRRVAHIEIAEMGLSAKLFDQAIKDMPMYTSRIQTLQKNMMTLNGLNHESPKLPLLRDDWQALRTA